MTSACDAGSGTVKPDVFPTWFKAEPFMTPYIGQPIFSAS